MGLDNNTSIHLGEESVKDAGKTKYTVCALALGKHKEYPNAEIQSLFNVTFHFHFCSLILKVDFKYIYPLRYFFLYLKCSLPYCTLNSHIQKKKEKTKKKHAVRAYYSLITLFQCNLIVHSHLTDKHMKKIHTVQKAQRLITRQKNKRERQC